MSQNSSILVRFHPERGSSDTQDHAFEILSVPATKSAIANNRHARDRDWTIARWCGSAAACTAIVAVLAYQSNHLPSSIRIPLVTSKSDFAPLGDLSASISDIIDRAVEDEPPAPILPAPPKQDLLKALPDVIASPTPPAGQSYVLSLEDMSGTKPDSIELIVGGPTSPTPDQRSALSATVRRGTFIPAILETPIDPKKPSGVRAMVPVDVPSRAGGMTVPRSARLVGQYYAKVSEGRQRVYIIWKQFIMPDGSTEPIPSGSISQDQFFESFGSASMISLVETRGPSGALDRLSSGEPLRIITSKDVAVSRPVR